MSVSSSFADLFDKFRLKSGLNTYSKLGEALAEQGFIYEDSIFSRWKNKNRIPRDRSLILGLSRVFIKFGGINSIREVESMLYAAGLRGLDYREISELELSSLKKNLPYQKFKPLIEPSNLYQNIELNRSNFTITRIQDLALSYQRKYWTHQVRCGVSEFYSYVSGGKYSPNYFFKLIVEEDEDQFNWDNSTFVVVASDYITGREYLVSSVRLVRSPGTILPFMNCFTNGLPWPHALMKLHETSIAELDRFILPNWALDYRELIIRSGFDKIVEYCNNRGIYILYSMLTQPLVDLCEESNIPLSKVKDVLKTYENDKQLGMRSLPQIEASSFTSIWDKNVDLYTIFLKNEI